jgi:Zn-dependent protease/CBS domain-containing protein
MARRDIPIGRIFGIPIAIDYSWFLIFALLTWLLASSYFPAEFRHWPTYMYWIIGAVTAIMLFVSVLIHELGHSLVARRYEVPVKNITLFIFGGVSQITAEPPRPLPEFFIAVIGPAISIVLGVIFFAVAPLFAGAKPLWALVRYLGYINIALGIFNLLPAFPLDGGRVFRSIVWGITKNMRRSTIIAANVGRFFGFLFILFGFWQILMGNIGGGIWIGLIGWFLESAASSQAHQVEFQGVLSGHKVSEAMSSRCGSVPEELTIQQLVDRHILEGGQRCFLVTHGEAPVGLMTLHRIREVNRPDWSSTTASQVMLPLDKLKHINAETDLWAALQMMDRDGVNQLPVMNDGQVTGMLSREDVITFLRTLRELGM